MTTDTPESVRELIAELDAMRHPDSELQYAAIVTLRRYAKSLERTCEWVYVGDDCHKPKCCGALSSTLCETVAGYMKFCPYCGARIVEVRE